MQARQRIIVALDVDTLEKAADLVKALKDHVGYFKVGLELLSAEGAPKVIDMVHRLGGKIFYDGKFKDIPNTIEGATRAVVNQGVEIFNLHCDGGPEMMKAAVETANEITEKNFVKKPLILGVTLLTSLDYEDLIAMGIRNVITGYTGMDIIKKQKEKDQVERIVSKLALQAQICGLDGVIASPKEIKVIRKNCGPKFLIVTPGIRPDWAQVNDQKRVMTPKEAIIDGTDYLVIGRPITSPPKNIGDPTMAADLITKEIEEGLVLKILGKYKAVLANDHFVYTSGKHGKAYVNKDAIYPHVQDVSEICEIIAWRAYKHLPQVVIAPAIGGVALSQWTAHHLNEILKTWEVEVFSVYAEKENDDFVIKRGYDQLIRGKKVLVVEDVLTTGGSVEKVIKAVKEAGGNIVSIGALCNRGNITAERFGPNGKNFFSLIDVPLEAWEETECPLCKQGIPINTEVGKGREYLAKKQGKTG